MFEANNLFHIFAQQWVPTVSSADTTPSPSYLSCLYSFGASARFGGTEKVLRCALRHFDKRSCFDRHKQGRELLSLIQTRSYGASCEGGDSRICLTI